LLPSEALRKCHCCTCINPETGNPTVVPKCQIVLIDYGPWEELACSITVTCYGGGDCEESIYYVHDEAHCCG
jgi:hypothetical protein